MEQEVREFSTAELDHARARGWERKDVTDEEGIRRLYFVSRQGVSEVIQGSMRSWFSNGKPRHVAEYRDGKLDGPLREWHPTGVMSREGAMRYDAEEGFWRFWREDGSRFREGTYRRGVPDGLCAYFHADGRSAARGLYRAGLQEGLWDFWPKEGAPMRHAFREGVAAPFSPMRHRGLPPPISGDPARFDVRVDERLELLAVVQSFTDWATEGPWTTPDNPYARAVAAWFEPYRSHPAIQKVREIYASGTNFAFDGPPTLILHFSDLPELRPLTPTIRPDLVARAGGAKQLEALLPLLRDFVRESRFLAFFESQQPLYRKLVADYRKVSPGQRALDLLQNHYGETREAFTIAISPLIGGANYGVQVDERGGRHIYNIGAPALLPGGRFAFDPESVRSLIYHEFGHSFMNPIVDTQPSFFAYGERLFPPVAARMRGQGYGGWEATLYELFVRTGETRLQELSGATAEARRAVAKNVQSGFLWLPYALALLKEFEGQRKRYPRFRDFYPQMERVFRETEPFFVGPDAICALPQRPA